MALALDFAPPINEESKKIDQRYYDELMNKAYDSISMASIYVQQIPNIRLELKPISNRMIRFKKAGLIGCLNETGVTSSNYKKVIYNSIETDSTT